MASNVLAFPACRPVLAMPQESLTSKFGMGLGIASPLWSPTTLIKGDVYLKVCFIVDAPFSGGICDRLASSRTTNAPLVSTRDAG